MAQAPIAITSLGANVFMLSGPGGNTVVFNGSDGKIVIDGFVEPAWPQLNKTLNEIGQAPIRMVINTHWHLDHTDNNANFRRAGATIIAHENTKKRLSEVHEVFGMRVGPAAEDALPTHVLKRSETVRANGESIELGPVPPGHTDTDLYVRFVKANVLCTGDVFWNASYPFFDPGTGGSINGIIAAAKMMLGMINTATKIVPGHGPLGDRAAVEAFINMLMTVRNRVKKLKAEGKTLDTVLTLKPSADFDEHWASPLVLPTAFVANVYNTL